MRKRLTAVLLSTSTVVLAIGLGTATASATAAKTWTISPGGAVSGTAGVTTLTDSKTGTVLKCQSSDTAAKLESGSGQKNPIGEISSVTFNTCTGPGGLTFTATTSASTSNPWPLTGNSYNSTTGLTKGTITNISASLSGNGCTATVGGTTSTSTGTTDGNYSNKTHILTAKGGDLHVWNVSAGCLGLINTGDPTTFVGKYTVSPKQTITSP